MLTSCPDTRQAFRRWASIRRPTPTSIINWIEVNCEKPELQVNMARRIPMEVLEDFGPKNPNLAIKLPVLIYRKVHSYHENSEATCESCIHGKIGEFFREKTDGAIFRCSVHKEQDKGLSLERSKGSPCQDSNDGIAARRAQGKCLLNGLSDFDKVKTDSGKDTAAVHASTTIHQSGSSKLPCHLLFESNSSDRDGISDFQLFSVAERIRPVKPNGDRDVPKLLSQVRDFFALNSHPFKSGDQYEMSRRTHLAMNHLLDRKNHWSKCNRQFAEMYEEWYDSCKHGNIQMASYGYCMFLCSRKNEMFVDNEVDLLSYILNYK